MSNNNIVAIKNPETVASGSCVNKKLGGEPSAKHSLKI